MLVGCALQVHYRELKHTEVSPILTDSLCLRVAQIPRARDVAIFVVMTTTDDRQQTILIALYLAHACGVITNYLQIGVGYNYFCIEPLCGQPNHTACSTVHNIVIQQWSTSEHNIIPMYIILNLPPYFKSCFRLTDHNVVESVNKLQILSFLLFS